MHLHTVAIRGNDVYVAYLLAYLQLVLQRHVAALQVAYQVVERAGRGINVHRHTTLQCLGFLCDDDTAADGQALGIDHGLLAFDVNGTQVAVHVVHVLQQHAVAVERHLKRIGEHLGIVEERVLFLKVYRQVGLQGQLLSVYLYGKMAVHRATVPLYYYIPTADRAVPVRRFLCFAACRYTPVRRRRQLCVGGRGQ